MSKKTLNKENLKNLGADRLADLVLDLVKGNAALQRRARLELSANLGPKDIASELRKRLGSIRRAKTFIDWKAQRSLVKDLENFLSMVETKVAPHDANEAFELLWSLLDLAASIHERTDDSSGRIGDVFSDTVEAIGRIAPKITINSKTLAERILIAVADAGYGEFDDIIPATKDALGASGLSHLKKITNEWAARAPEEEELRKVREYGDGFSRSPEKVVRDNKDITQSIILADIADAEGDVDAYMARYTAEQLNYHTIAPGVATRLLAAGRAEEALEVVTRSREAQEKNSKSRPDDLTDFYGHDLFDIMNHDLEDVYEDCLEQLGEHDDLKAHLWQRFCRNLEKGTLQKYLKLLPDFEDIEAERKALDHAQTYPRMGTAINFLVTWPAHELAERMIIKRAEEVDGNAYYILSDAAASLDGKHSLAATLLRRAMIEDTLKGAKSKRYRYAAKHLAECKASNPAITDYCGFPDHTEFLENLKQKHKRKSGFWSLVKE